VLTGYLDIIYIAFLDNIMVYSERVKNHIEYILKILERLKQYSLYTKLSKCLFFIIEVKFLRYIMRVAGVLMDLYRVAIIQD
jgi:hypothetical protein